MAAGAERAAKFDDAMGKLSDTSQSLDERTRAVGDAMKSASDDTDKAAVSAEAADLRMQGAGEAAAYLTKAMEGARSEFNLVSAAAGTAFDTAFQGALKAQGIMPAVTAAVDKTKNSMEQLRQAAEDDIVGLDKWMYALAKAQEATQQKVDAQRQGIQDLTKEYDQLGTNGAVSYGILGNNTDAILSKLQSQRDLLQNSNGEFNLLGHQELAPLQQALDGAIARVQQLASEAAAAKQQFDSLAKSTHDALLQEQGNLAALEDERHQQQLSDLQTAAEKSNSLNSSSYQQAVSDENKLHELKMKNIADQAAAAKAASSSSSSTSSTSTASSASSSPSSIQTPTSNSPPNTGGGIPIQVNHGSRTVNLVAPNINTADLFEEMMRDVMASRANSIFGR